jgi:hypothetical protein
VCAGWSSRLVTVVLKFFSLELILIFTIRLENLKKENKKIVLITFGSLLGCFMKTAGSLRF